MLIRTQHKETLIDVTGKWVGINEEGLYWYVEVRELVSNSNELVLILGCYPTEEKARQVLNDIEVTWSKWTSGSPAYHMPDENGVIDMSDVEATEAMHKHTAQTPEVYGDGYDNSGNLIYDTWKCPRCGMPYEIDYDDYDYCPKCGQKIDWSEFKE